MSINCYAALKAKAPLEKFDYQPAPLGASDIKVDITHCGICHSDLHIIDNDWRMNNYPAVPGHEIIGIISALGENVKDLEIGQRVGIGWQAKSCGNCEWCLNGEENLCSDQEATCVGNYGGFADSIQVHSNFAFPIPDTLPSEIAAPLLCAGITVFSPLKKYINNDKSKKVGIIGIGGLGHLALQFAYHMGYDITAFSSSQDKRDSSIELGATDFTLTSDAAAMAKMHNSFDLILSTSAAPIDFATYTKFLRPKGTLCLVSALTSPLNVPILSLISGRKNVCGSNIGSRQEIKEMLAFAAKHNIKPLIETARMFEVNSALDKVRAGSVRYRMVLCT